LLLLLLMTSLNTIVPARRLVLLLLLKLMSLRLLLQFSTHGWCTLVRYTLVRYVLLTLVIVLCDHGTRIGCVMATRRMLKLSMPSRYTCKRLCGLGRHLFLWCGVPVLLLLLACGLWRMMYW
jgi:hypothetical protein